MVSKETRCPQCKRKTLLPGKGCPGCEFLYDPGRDPAEIAVEMKLLAQELRCNPIESWMDEEGEIGLGYQDKPLWSYLAWATLFDVARTNRETISRILADALETRAMWILSRNRRWTPW